MKRILILPMVSIILCTTFSCTLFLSPKEKRIKETTQSLIETDERVVQGCRCLGTVQGTVDVGNIFLFFSKTRCKNKAKHNAAILGATHIVWLYIHQTSAAALAYKCEIKDGGQNKPE
ncbi:MAG: hypothetical protein SWH54_16515 [Thermodesulfobacteriota bacterium]|nr:hypothetical protein [Thermodesulfobacteriota bacterium]